jgi:Tfp pilus assembly protein FimT
MRESLKNYRTGERGFSLIEMVVTIGVIFIVVGFAALGITRARASMRLQNSARIFAGNLEKARIDAIRRRSAAQVDIASSTAYDVTMDFNGNGTTTTRRYYLESGVNFTDSTGATMTIDADGNCTSCPSGELAPSIDFDKRGRTLDCTTLFRLKNSNSATSIVQVMGSGDITVDSSVSTANAMTYSNVNSTSDVVSTAVVTGSGLHPNFNPCDTSSGSGSSTSAPAATTGASGCTIQPSTGLLTVRRNGGSSASVNVVVNSAGTITATLPSNLSASPTTRSVTSSSGGTFSFTISSNNRTRGLFTVSFTNSCGTTSIQVKVTN